jgi:hypothetical protein
MIALLLVAGGGLGVSLELLGPGDRSSPFPR